jgi:predicted nuclease of restriction endonuclease-like (RecB) superfamily
MAELILSEYQNWLTELKAKIRATQLRAALAVHHELLALYWELGKTISTKLSLENWGASVVEKAAQDLQKAFPDQKGFSRSNLFSMLKWYEFYSSSSLDSEKVQQLVGQIPWGHNVLIITKSKIVAEYALRGTSQPLGIAAYDLSRAIPAELQSSLPTIEKIEKELSK